MIVSFSGKNEFLSNFYRARVEMEGLVYPSVEHAYQAAKTLDLKKRMEIRDASTPGAAKSLGRSVVLRMGWNETRLAVMEKLLRQKFAPGTSLASKLLATGDQILIEGNWWGDTFWGICKGEGENHLGKLLMKIRIDLQKLES